MTKNLHQICQQVQEVCTEVGVFLKQEIDKIAKNAIETKSVRSFVTYVDKQSEQKLVKALRLILPEAGFITEEETVSYNNEEYIWIIDPLDGTTNYIHGLPCYSISIGLMYKNEIILGVVYEPNLKEMFYSWFDVPSFCNTKEIKVSSSMELTESFLATGFPYFDYKQMLS